MTSKLLLIMFISGCAMYGSRSKLYQKENVKSTLVLLYQNQSEFYERRQLEYHVINELEKNSKFRFLVLNDNISNAFFLEDNQVTKRFKHFDNYLIVERSKKGLADQKIKLYLYNESKQLLFYSKHDTFWGNSYFSFPSYPVMTRDAVRGAFAKLFKKYLN